ncbi:bifunctional acetate--CoA ligase family protein/GNAT family N-acetyltransferase [Chelatococcus reniformis]|uniref:GCN5 family N-acetyltransferase n=1 Tax=Chelatococcus reniformis TaxID=1494448 RepID=A0A916X976_9HYPH|nr:bifunctional acetate--CoA ligase family protein/GNAT family N-acetyltransferase [Chelatococcus reniformis]GGC54001.1 GCN5 family N-acetyltransferase [Chelatococcus reniformis]
MSIYRLDKLFAPASVAVVGASGREGSLGRTVLGNLEAGGFAGPVYAVNPRFADPTQHLARDGVICVPELGAIAPAPELVVVVSPPPTVVEIVTAAGQAGAAAAVLMTEGLGAGEGSIAEAARREARRYGLRLVGPKCMGVITPHARLHASLGARLARPGDLALVSQSGPIAAAIVEWATRRQIGFSGIVALGDQVDVDIADCLDYFAGDEHTRALLMYVDTVADAAKFVSAARAAARVKPIVVIKSGRHAQTAELAATHTGALAAVDAVYDAAFRRSGLLRVLDLDELFAAAETLSRQRPFHGRRLAVMANDHGVGLLAVDRLVDLGGTLAELSEATRSTLAALLPGAASANPVDITGFTDARTNAAVLTALLNDKGTDALLVVNIPTAFSDPVALARSTVDAVAAQRRGRALHKPVFVVWLGQNDEAGRIFDTAGIPHYATEAEALAGFMHLVRYREGQALLMETPDALPRDFVPDTGAAQRIVRRALGEGRAWLDMAEAQDLLAAYDIPAPPAAIACTADAAVAAARPILAAGGTVAVKLLAPQVMQKSDVGGVHLDLASEAAVRQAASELLAFRGTPEVPVEGAAVMVQAMVRRRGARELIAGLADDPTFGPVVVFGRGGTAAELINDKALALPPLDMKLAETLIARTRVVRILGAFRDTAAADEHAIRLVLVKLSQLATDLPEVRELDINPLLADADGVMALDVRVRVAPVERIRSGTRHPRMAIRPYPKAWERTISGRSGRTFFVRPVRPEDEGLFIDFVRRVSEADVRLRFFAPIRDFNHAFMARLVQVDYARAIAFVAIDGDSGEMAGVVRLHADANHERGEYAVLIRSDLKGTGLGWELMHLIIDWARAEGIRVVEGQVLRENTAMLAMCRKLGFSIRPDVTDPSVMIVELPLRSGPDAVSTRPVLDPAASG